MSESTPSPAGAAAVTHEQVPTNGIELHVASAGPADGPPVVLCHGFPELWYSWRHQLGPLAAAGYRVLAPDLRGYGDSTRPKEVAAYGSDSLTGDLCGLLDHYGYDTAAFVGHDWGALVLWEMGRLHPGRVSSLFNMSVPFSQSPGPPTETFKVIFEGKFFYIMYFQPVGPAEAELEADPRHFLRTILYAAGGEAMAERQRPAGRLPERGHALPRHPDAGAGETPVLADARRTSTSTPPPSRRAGSSARSATTATWTPTGSGARIWDRRRTPCPSASSPARSMRWPPCCPAPSKPWPARSPTSGAAPPWRGPVTGCSRSGPRRPTPPCWPSWPRSADLLPGQRFGLSPQRLGWLVDGRQRAPQELELGPQQGEPGAAAAVLVTLAGQLEVLDGSAEGAQGLHELRASPSGTLVSSSPCTTSSGALIRFTWRMGEMRASSQPSRRGSPYLVTAAWAIQGSVSR